MSEHVAGVGIPDLFEKRRAVEILSAPIRRPESSATHFFSCMNLRKTALVVIIGLMSQTSASVRALLAPFAMTG